MMGVSIAPAVKVPYTNPDWPDATYCWEHPTDGDEYFYLGWSYSSWAAVSESLGLHADGFDVECGSMPLDVFRRAIVENGCKLRDEHGAHRLDDIAALLNESVSCGATHISWC